MGIGQSSSRNHGHNVLLLGLNGSGKTSILARLLQDDPRTVLPTLGFSMKAFSVDGGKHVLKMWDVGGGPSVREFWSTHYKKTHAIIFVINSNDRRRLMETSMCLQQVLDSDELIDLPLLVYANKQDTPDAISASELEVLLHLGSIRDRSWRCVECSAISGAGIEDGIRWLVREFGHGKTSGRGAELSPGISESSRFRRRGGSGSSAPARETGGGDDDDDDDEEQQQQQQRATTTTRRRQLPFNSPQGSSGAEGSSAEGSAAPAPAESTTQPTKTRAQRQLERRKAAEKAASENKGSDDDAQSD